MIDNLYDGIGDAMMYIWIAHSADHQGQQVRLNLRRWKELGRMFMVEHLLTDASGERAKNDDGKGSSHWRDEAYHVGRGVIQSRFCFWSKSHGLEGLSPIRPKYIECPASAEWAEKVWADRDKAMGGKRVVFVPGCAWEQRKTPNAIMCQAATDLVALGCNVVAVDSDKNAVDNFPYYFFGLSLPQVAAFLARADLVICNDSGMAHIAGTIGRKVLAVCGLTNPAVVFGHMPNVSSYSVDKSKVGCVGCHFGKPFRSACMKGCLALHAIDPGDLTEAAMRAFCATARKEI